jgi:hypothetical protein
LSRIFGELRQNAYVVPDIAAGPGAATELSEVSGGKGLFFGRIPKAAASWYGSNPIRRR